MSARTLPGVSGADSAAVADEVASVAETGPASEVGTDDAPRVQRRPFRPPWWAGNKTAAATAVDPPAAAPRSAPALVDALPEAPIGAPADLPAPRSETLATRRVDTWFAAHGGALLWLVPVMVFAAVVAVLGVAAPVRSAQEAVYTGYVWDLVVNGDTAPFTAWAQHPPLGWMQMAAYAQATGAFDRWDLAVLAVRESMVLFAAATAGAAWLLARRIGLSRFVATIATVVLVLSPFALAQHTSVSIENVAAPWLLVAFLLATARRFQPLAFGLSAAAFAVAVMSAETALIALPFLAWVMVQATRQGRRVWPIVAAAVTLQIVAGVYLVIASRDDAAAPPVAPVFAAVTGGPAGLAAWWAADPVLLVLVVVGAAAGLVIRRLRPYAALTLAGVVLLALPGVSTADGVPALLLPFGIVVLVGATEAAVHALRARGAQRSALPLTLVAVVALGAVVAVPLALTRLPVAFSGRTDDPITRAEEWLLDNVDGGSTVLVDTASRVDFQRAGWSRDTVIDYSLASDPLPERWTDAQWAVVPSALEDQASNDSVVVASFDDVDVRRVLPGAVDVAAEAEAARAEVRATLGGEVVENPDLELADADRDLLASGEVDDRIVSVLGALTAFGRIDVAGFPVVAGEEDGPRRQVAIVAADGNPMVEGGDLTAAGRNVVGGLLDRYTPQSATVQGGLLVLRYPITLGEPAE